MNDNDKHFFTLLFATIIILIISISASIAYYKTNTAKAAIEAGYQQQTLPGQTGVHWVKIKE